MKASSCVILPLLACLLVGWSGSVAATRLRAARPAGSRFSAFPPWTSSRFYEDRQPVEKVTNFLYNLRSIDAPNWMYVHANEKGVQGFSVRISDKFMLTPKSIKADAARHAPARELPDVFDVKQIYRYELKWEGRPETAVSDLSFIPWLTLGEFRLPSNQPQPHWEPELLTIGGEAWKAPGMLCRLLSIRNLANNQALLTYMDVNVVCENGPHSHVCLIEGTHKYNNTFEFCPEDNGAPIFCDSPQVAFMVHIESGADCDEFASATNMTPIREDLLTVIKSSGEEPKI